MMRIKWTDRITKEAMLRKLCTNRELVNKLKRKTHHIWNILLDMLLRRKEIFNGTCCKVKPLYLLFALIFCNSNSNAAFAPNHASRNRFL